MPITIAQPSPVGAAASGGRVDARLQQQALQQRQQLALADLYQRSAIANAQIGEQSAGRYQDAKMLQAQLASREFGEQEQTRRQEMAIAGDQQSIASRVAGQMMLQDQELSQAERLRLQRMKSALAEVQSADWLSPEQKQAYGLEIKTGINAYEQRNAAMTVKLKEQAYNEAIEQTRMRAAVEAETQAFKAKTLPDRFITKDIPGIGPMTFYEKSPGQYEAVQGPKQEAPKEVTPRDRAEGEAKIDKAVTEIAEREADRAIGRDNPGWAEYRNRVYDRERGRYAAASQPAGGSGQPQAQPGGGQQLASPDNFLAAIASRPDLRPDQKQGAAAAIATAQEILAKAGGDFNKLSDEDKREIIRLKEYLDTMKAPPPPAPAPAPPAPAAPRMPGIGGGISGHLPAGA